MPDDVVQTAKKKRSIRMADPLWNALRRAKAELSIAEGREVSLNELVRRGTRRELAAIFGNGEYEQPPEVAEADRG